MSRGLKCPSCHGQNAWLVRGVRVKGRDGQTRVGRRKRCNCGYCGSVTHTIPLERYEHMMERIAQQLGGEKKEGINV